MRLYSNRGYIDLKLISYSTPISTNFSTSITRSKSVHYPVSYRQGSLTAFVQCRSRAEANKIHRFIRRHHEDVQADSTNTLRIVDSKRGIDYRGVCPKPSDARSLTEFAPTIVLRFTLTKDSLSQVTTDSSIGNDWREIYEDGYGSLPGTDRGPSTITPIRPR